MADDGSGFLSRWSRRKAQARSAEPAVEPDEGRVVEPAAATVDARVDAGAAAATAAISPAPDAAAEPRRVGDDALAHARPQPAATQADVPAARVTLDDVARLTPEADFSSFVDRAVAPEVRNAAMKKLFADPHFNVMDGLDVYIDDYNKTEPLPRQWLRQMMQARALGLLDDEVQEQPRPDEWAPTPEPDADAALAASLATPESTIGDTAQASPREDPAADAAQADPYDPAAHEDPDLPLQRDDAAGPGGVEPRAGDEPGRG